MASSGVTMMPPPTPASAPNAPAQNPIRMSSSTAVIVIERRPAVSECCLRHWPPLQRAKPSLPTQAPHKLHFTSPSPQPPTHTPRPRSHKPQRCGLKWWNIMHHHVDRQPCTSPDQAERKVGKQMDEIGRASCRERV